MGTDVFYGPVWMHGVTTRKWDQEIVYDDSDTDNQRSKFSLEFEGLIHLQTALLPANSPAFTANVQNVLNAPLAGQISSASLIYQQIRACLHEPRQALVVQFNGTTVLRCVHKDDGNDPDADVDNGPKPRLVSLTHIVSDSVFQVRFAIECSKVECCTTAGMPPRTVLSNRWSVRETMDANFFTTRTVTGRLRLSQSMSKAQLQGMRPLIVPTLESGFRRETIEVATLPNGLEADYTVIDKQVHTAAPYPATKMSGHFVESNDQNIYCFSELSVRLEGAPNSDKRLMMTRAAQVAAARLGDPNTWTGSNGTLIEQISLIESIGEENAVEFRVRLKRTPATVQGAGQSAFIGNLPAGTFGLPLKLPSTPKPYDPATSTAPALWGYNPGDASNKFRDPNSVLYLLRCYLQSPCDDKHGQQQLVTLVQGPAPNQTASPTSQTTVSTATVSNLTPWQPQDPPKLSTDAATMYLHARQTSSYRTRRQRLQLPLAGNLALVNQDASRFVTLGRPQCVREIICDAERVSQPPTMPPPLDTFTEGNGITAKLLDHAVELFSPTLSVDATQKIYRVRGRYLYALSRAPLLGEKLQSLVLPFTNLTLADAAIDPAKLYDGRLGPAPAISNLFPGGFAS